MASSSTGSWDDYIHIILVNGSNSCFFLMFTFLYLGKTRNFDEWFFEMGFKPPTRITYIILLHGHSMTLVFIGVWGLLLQLLKPTNREETGCYGFFQTDRTCNYLWAWPQVYCKSLERKQLGIRSNGIFIKFSPLLYLGSTPYPERQLANQD